MEISKAIVLAAECSGAEPWPTLGLAARQLVPVANRPVFFHHLDALHRAGVRQVLVVADERTGPALNAAVVDAAQWEMEIRFEHATAPDDALGVVLAAEFGDPGPAHVHHADVLLAEPLAALGARFVSEELEALVVHMAGSPHPEELAGYILGRAAQERLRGLTHEQLDAAIVGLGREGARLGVHEVAATLPCRGSAAEIIDANRDLLDALVPGTRGERVWNSQIQGRVDIHPSAEVTGSVIRGPVTIGPRARVSDTFIGPYTSIGADVHLDSVEIEHSVVLEGASLRFVGTRIEGSLIGPGAQIERDFGVPRAIRMSVGAGAELKF
jgi:glucose-1-phosphate thymidylyltransferase